MWGPDYDHRSGPRERPALRIETKTDLAPIPASLGMPSAFDDRADFSGITTSVVLRADRPFLFAVRDVPTGAILYLGRVRDPSIGR